MADNVHHAELGGQFFDLVILLPTLRLLNGLHHSTQYPTTSYNCRLYHDIYSMEKMAIVSELSNLVCNHDFRKEKFLAAGDQNHKSFRDILM